MQGVYANAQTKHFQTLFWGWKREVKIVDCPGLVCPSLVGMEIQALCGSTSGPLDLPVTCLQRGELYH